MPDMPRIRMGMLGGGQLGRMSAMAASRLGIETHIYCPDDDAPALQVTQLHTKAAYEDETALRRFAEQVDVITYEFENIPEQTARFLHELKPVRPSPNVLGICQDRLAEKSFLNDSGIPTARFAEIQTENDVVSALKSWKSDKSVIKTTRFGYDGKGQAKIDEAANISKIIADFANFDLILEDFIAFDGEISVLVARDVQGRTAFYGPTWNEHDNHILSRSLYPPPIGDATSTKALILAGQIASALDLVGLLAIEMFVLPNGEILVNEMAPRPHNSGHWTIDACAVSQFENHVRTICGLAVGDTAPHSAAEMINLLGDDALKLDAYMAMPDACVHLYGKRDAKPGRKMGHVTLLRRDLSLKGNSPE
jgi:5-(carboxyamino)imidazole ribonucleotide synthase